MIGVHFAIACISRGGGWQMVPKVERWKYEECISISCRLMLTIIRPSARVEKSLARQNLNFRFQKVP